MHLFDLLEKREIVPHEEANRLNALLNSNLIQDGYTDMSLKTILNHGFRKTKVSSTFLTIDELLKYLKIYEITLDWHLKDLFLYIETIHTIVFQSINRMSSFANYSKGTQKDITNVISDFSTNINVILDKTNYKLFKKDNFVYITENKASVSEAIECIEDEEVSLELLEYNRYSLKGNIKEKAKVLSSLAKYIEPIRESKILSKNNYNTLESDIGFYLNKFHIRHNNLDVKNPSEFLKKMTDEELESWYDIIYNTIIAIIITKAQIENHKKLEELKKENNL